MTNKGTPHWMAPEIIKGQPYNEKVDIWSFGIFVYELAENSPPFFNVAENEIPEIILNSEIPPINEKYSDDFRSFLEDCLRKKPEERWSAKDLLEHKFLLHADSEERLSNFKRVIGRYDAKKAEELASVFDV